MPAGPETLRLLDRYLAAGHPRPPQLSLFGMTEAQEMRLWELLHGALAEGRPLSEEELAEVTPPPLPEDAQW